MEEAIKKRDYGFDNLKLFLIVLVVLGHLLEEISLEGNLGIIRSVIYSFHMPLFIFISGYFSKNGQNRCSRALSDYLIPFFVFNSLYTVLFTKYTILNIFLPKYAFWYLLSLFFWNVGIEAVSKFKPILIISVLLGLYCGLFDDIDRLFSLSRTICFFPFFILGYKFSDEKIKKLRSFNKALPIICIALCAGATAMLNYKEIIPVKMYEMIQSYGKNGVENLSGVLQRLIIYVLAFALVLSIVAVVPNKEHWFTEYGKRTVCIYIFSSFLIKWAFELFKNADMSFAYKNTLTELAFAIILEIVIILLTANKYVFKAYSFFIRMIRKVFIR